MVKKILVGLGVLGLVMSLGVGQARAASLTGYDTIDLGNSSSKVYATGTFMALRTGRDLLGIKSASEIRMFGDITAGNTAGTDDIGSATREWGHVFVADDKYLQMGSDQDILMGYDEATDNRLEWTDGTNTLMYLTDQGTTGDLATTGDLTVSGGELYVTPVASSASTTEGTIYYDSDVDNLYVYANGAFVDLTAGDTSSYSLDDAYNNDSGERTVTVDGGTVSWDVTGGYDYVVDIQGTGNFIVQDAGTAMFTVADGGATTLIGAFTVGVDDTGHDVKFFGATASSYLLWDESDDRLEFDGADVNLQDDDILQFGDAQDVYMRWDGSDFDILASTNAYVMKFGDGTESFDIWWYGSIATNTVIFDEGADTVTLDNVDLRFGDNDFAQWGDAQDVTMDWDGTNFDVLAAANAQIMRFGDGTESWDIWWYGSIATNTVIFDEGADTVTFDNVDVYMGDADLIDFGDAQDLKMRWDGTDFDILAAADDTVIKFGDGTESWDVWWYGDTAAKYLEWDASADKLTITGGAGATALNIATGNTVLGGDFTIDTNVFIVDATANTVTVGTSSGTNYDVYTYGNTAAALMLWDASDDRLEFNGADVNLQDDDILQFGDAQDAYMRWDGTDFDILAAVNASLIKFGDGTVSWDMWWYGSIATNTVIFDEGGDTVTFDNVDLRFGDNDFAQWGDAQDVTMDWDGTNFDILAAADDSSMRFGASGANAFDVLVYGDVANEQLDWDASSGELTIKTIVADTTSNSGLLVELTDNSAASGDARGIYVDIKDGAASPVAAIDVLHEDTGQALSIGMRLQAAASATITKAIEILAGSSGVITTALDVSDAEIATAISYGANTILGTGDIGSTSSEIGDVFLADGKAVQFGAAQDVTMDWDGTNFDVLALTNASIMRFGDGTSSWDIWWYGSIATNTVIFDEGGDTVTFDNVDLYMGDADLVDFGDAQDIQMRWDGTNFDVLGAAADSEWNWGVDNANSIDMVWHGSATGDAVTFDASANTWTYDDVDLYMDDDDILAFGDDQDVQMRWDQTDLDILAAANASIIKFGDGTESWDIWWYGSIATNTVIFDEGSDAVIFDNVDIKLGDADILQLGDGPDASLTYDEAGEDRVELTGSGATLYIEDRLSLGVQALTITDDGTANDALTPTATYVKATVDATANGGTPDLTIVESSADDGDLLIIVNDTASNDSFTIGDEAGVTNGSVQTLGTDDVAMFIYIGDIWLQVSASNN